MNIYTKFEGTTEDVTVMLHGTGGNEQSLVPIAKFLTPDASLIGIRGEVEEGDMLRYFKRYHDGTFDLKSLMKESRKLEDTFEALLPAGGRSGKTVVGYSNGSNVMINILKEFGSVFENVILLHPVNVRPEVNFPDLEGVKVFLTYGENDPFLEKEDFQDLVDALIESNATVEVFEHENGHSIMEDEVLLAKEFIK